MAVGYVSLVLHAHLPFVRHPDREDYLEERWLFEANTECYLPLLIMLERLAAEKIPFRLTLSLSPTLMAMFDDNLLRDRYQRYLEASIGVAEREVALIAGGAQGPIAHLYRHLLHKLYRLYTREYNRDLNSAFHRFAQVGYLDLITCAATHGFLPLLQHQPATVRAQIQIAIREFRHRFGHLPRGFWLPECGYSPGIDQALREAGIQYCFLETHALTHARPEAPHGTFSHAWTPTGLALFGRDPASSQQVWSAHEGYPGDGAYRDFYRDIGFERTPAHLGRLAGPDGIRTFSGFKYYRVTGPTEHKDLYDRWAAEQTAIRHAAHFVHERVKQVTWLRGALPSGPAPLIVAPYDAELFGHWWFEGPFFLEQVARHAAQRPEIRFITPADYLDLFPAGQGTLEPPLSSWGYLGYADFWCDRTNHWIYRHLHRAGDRMIALANRHQTPSPLYRRTLAQAARELLLAQASDWAFMMRAGTSANYAQRRLHAHLGRFNHLADRLDHTDGPDLRYLTHIEAIDNLFPDLNYRLYAME